ncbi:MAG: hypothetical protein ACRDON_01360 [Gaiellaceae bacterium]
MIVAPVGAAPATPVAATPDEGVVADAVPVFGWEPVAGADRYEWEIAADPGFNSPVLGSSYDHFFTRNTRATLKKTIPNGTYWWHVRAVASNGSVSPWSPARSFTKSWARSPDLLAPDDGATFVYPEDHFRLAWEPVAGASRYLVTVATDPGLSSVVWSTGPVETQATAFSLLAPLAPDQTYFWGVTPIDGEGNRGSPSEVRSFIWEWPSTTATRVEDVAPESEIYDYEFSWDPVPGAAGYELEVNSSSDFAPGSRVCCFVNAITKLTTIGTSYAPTLVLPNNHYYWRVRALDPSRNAGVWNEGPEFTKSFDNLLPSVQNLRMLDNSFPTEGPFETSVPIVAWDPVPGASSYEVEVTVFAGGCQWTAPTNTGHWKSKTATTSWTPLGWGWNNVKPYESPVAVSVDTPKLEPLHDYCVRVTALDRPADSLSPYVRSIETYLPDESTPAFTWLGTPGGDVCSPSCRPGSLGSGDYLLPLSGEVKGSMPVFRWKPLAGYESYFVLVAKDPDFTNVVDYAFTRVSAYAPRRGFGPKTYPDETTSYYWAVLPAPGSNGSGVTTAPRFSAPQSFEKRSVPPGLLAPANGTVFPGAVRFHWTAVHAARRYRLQVSRDPTFGSKIVEEVLTDSTTYTSSVSYPADTNLYWRVRADAESVDVGIGVGLTWSATGQFRKTLQRPAPDPTNPTSGDFLPTWRWSPVPGAVSYDVELVFPNGTPKLFPGIPSAAATPTLLKGTGIWKWRVRANFPQVNVLTLTKGPWMAYQSFTRTIREPTNAAEDVTATRVLMSWDPKMGARNYRVQVSTRQDFGTIVESVATDNTSYAPLLTQLAYSTGGTFYWRVAAADDIIANVGDYTPARSFTLQAGTASRLPTTLTGTITRTTTAIRVRGSVWPNHRGKRVVVTLYRKRDGHFRALAVKRPTLSSTSRFATSFARPRPGTCKVTARFPGDVDHAPSAASKTFRC